MPLCQPAVVGPLSTLSTTVRVTGQMSGAIVIVFAMESPPREVARGTAGSADARIPLVAGVSLAANDLLVAVQNFNGEQSELPGGDLGMRVQPAPQSLPGVSFDSHVYACGRYVRIGGVVPGAGVEVACAGTSLGSAVGLEGYATVALGTPFPTGLNVTAYQTAPGLAPSSITNRLVDTLPVPQGQHLPPPAVVSPRGCDASIHVSKVYDGSLVTIERGDGSLETAGFDIGESDLFLVRHVEDGESLRIKQDVEKQCERPGDWSNRIIASPTEPVAAPVVVGPLCAGTSMVTLHGLRPGAIVHISIGRGVDTEDGWIFEVDNVYDGQTPPTANEYTFRLPSLPEGIVSATQELCGIVSPSSELVPIAPHEDNVEPVVILGPLFKCARTVSVSHVHFGAALQVFANRQGEEKPISDIVTVNGLEAAIPVAPYLNLGDRIFVVQWGCSDTGVRFGDEPVIEAAYLDRPEIVGSIFEGDHNVEVSGLPGARIEVWVERPGSGRFYAGATVRSALGAADIVETTFPLAKGDNVRAIQFLCNDQPSEPSDTVSVERFSARPFYLLGHNPNDTVEAGLAFLDGANALEPDVNVLEDDGSILCISHDKGDHDNFIPYLQWLHDAGSAALVYFDCKSPVANHDHGVKLLQAIRDYVTFDKPLTIILSVAKFGDAKLFDKIKWGLRPREALMIDEENDPAGVAGYFSGYGVRNQGYGNGISVANRFIGPNVRPSIERACALRAADYRCKFVNVWTINKNADMRLFIRSGVDGMISDDLDSLSDIVTEPLMASLVRKATIRDNPFIRPPFAYALFVHTGNRSHAGTDANVTFTLRGSAGSALVTFDTQKLYRMERGDWNFLVLQTGDLGSLQEITVQRDNQGNAPDWYLDRIQVRSARYGGAVEAVYDCWIDTTNPYTRALV